MDHLNKLFGSTARTKIMRLFLANPELFFAVPEISKRTKITKVLVRKELNILKSAGFLKKKIKGWFLNQTFPQLALWRILLVGSEIMRREDLASRFRGAGRIKLLVISGIFLQNSVSRIDLLIVGDNLKKELIERAIKGIEAEIGKEMMYAIFETPEFEYRHNMYDKLVYDILDNPHEAVIDLIDLKKLKN